MSQLLVVVVVLLQVMDERMMYLANPGTGKKVVSTQLAYPEANQCNCCNAPRSLTPITLLPQMSVLGVAVFDVVAGRYDAVLPFLVAQWRHGRHATTSSIAAPSPPWIQPFKGKAASMSGHVQPLQSSCCLCA